MKQLDFLVRIIIPHMRPLQNEHHSTTACNDADSRPTLRHGVHHISLPAPLDAQAGAEVHTGLYTYCISRRNFRGGMHLRVR